MGEKSLENTQKNTQSETCVHRVGHNYVRPVAGVRSEWLAEGNLKTSQRQRFPVAWDSVVRGPWAVGRGPWRRLAAALPFRRAGQQ